MQIKKTWSCTLGNSYKVCIIAHRAGRNGTLPGLHKTNPQIMWQCGTICLLVSVGTSLWLASGCLHISAGWRQTLVSTWEDECKQNDVIWRIPPAPGSEVYADSPAPHTQRKAGRGWDHGYIHIQRRFEASNYYSLVPRLVRTRAWERG